MGAAGIGAAVCESARYGRLGVKIDLSKVPVSTKGITPQEILICETQARYIVQVASDSVDEVLKALRSKTDNAAVIGEITNDDKEIFEYNKEVVAVIPNKPSQEELEILRCGE